MRFVAAFCCSVYCAAGSAWAAEESTLDAGAPSAQSEVEDLANEFDARLTELKAAVKTALPGDTHFLLTGFGFGQFDKEQGPNHSLAAGLGLIALWQLTDRLFTETELEIALGDPGSELNLEYLNLTFVAHDRLLLTGGLFLAPVGTWAERYHAPWINKLPDAPLGLGHDALVPESVLGLQARGAIPTGPTKLTYVAWVGGGARLNRGEDVPTEAGRLEFEDITRTSNVAFGGQVGFLPIPMLELDYSLYVSGVGDSRYAQVHAVSLSGFLDSDALHGTLEGRAELLLSLVDDITYDPDGALGIGPLRFANRRIAGYAQLAYRPTRIKVLGRAELVVRGDMLISPAEAPEPEQMQRLTVGLAVWVGQSTAVKLAYQLTRETVGDATEAELRNGFKAQLVMGF